MMFDCPVPACRGRHRIEYVMCAACWRRVPADLQQAVYAAWGRRRRLGDDASIAAHEEAKRAAIHAATEAQAA